MSEDTGSSILIPNDFDKIMQDALEYFNEATNQNLSYQDFIGSETYMTFYAIVQLVQNVEITISELSNQFINYIKDNNLTVTPISGTLEGIKAFMLAGVNSIEVELNDQVKDGEYEIALLFNDKFKDTEENRIIFANKLVDMKILGLKTIGTESITINVVKEVINQPYTINFSLQDDIIITIDLIKINRNRNYVGEQLSIKDTQDLLTEAINNINIGKDISIIQIFSNFGFINDFTISYSMEQPILDKLISLNKDLKLKDNVNKLILMNFRQKIKVTISKVEYI